jgi:RimJ/RimL family protein N-acetyltransferase
MRHDLVLEGYGVRLEPLAARHAPELSALIDASLWAWMTSPVPAGVEGVTALIEEVIERSGTLAFAVADADTGEVRGSTSFYDLAPAQDRVEIGSTYYGRRFWGGRTNPAAKMLLLCHAFEEWNLYRVALCCDARNLRSAAAIRRLGASPEGVLRGHRVAADGSRGDTAYFSVIAPEWPEVKRNLTERLSGS